MRYLFRFQPLVIFLAGFFTAYAEAASFDCTKAATPVEKMICADAELSALDEKLHEGYQKVLAAASEPYKSAFKQQQRAWLKENRSRCSNADCLRSMYQSRIQHWNSFSAYLASHPELPKLPNVVTYADIRTDVTVEKLPKQPAWDKPRPANFFQLAGSANKELCDATLAAFNESGDEPPGYYSRIHSLSSPGADSVHWLLYNAHEVQFQSLEPGKPLYSFSGLEYARIDLDGDSKPEHVYRSNNVLRSNYHQKLMIASVPLQERPDLLKIFEDECLEVYPRGDFCRETYNQIPYALSRSYPERKLIEWVFTREGSIGNALGDQASKELTTVRVDKHYEYTKNIAHESSAYWSLYNIGATVIAVSSPIFTIGMPPELFVFLPSKDQPGNLQCILMPRAWYSSVNVNQ